MKCKPKQSFNFIRVEEWLVPVFKKAGWSAVVVGDYFVSSGFKNVDVDVFGSLSEGVLMNEDEFNKVFSVEDDDDPFLEDIKIENDFDPFYVLKDYVLRDSKETAENSEFMKNYINGIEPHHVCRSCKYPTTCVADGICQYTGSPMTNPDGSS